MYAEALSRPLGAASLAALVTVNVTLGLALATGRTVGVAVSVLPATLVALGALISSNRSLLLFGGLALGVATPLPFASEPLPLPFGGSAIYASDVLLLLGVGAWVAAWLLAEPGSRPRLPKTPLLGWPLLLFGVFLVAALVRGNERYGTPIFGTDLRILLYASAAFLLSGLSAKAVYRGIVFVFYAGAATQALVAVYRLATGEYQSENLSTGGARVLAVSPTMYMTGALVLALLNVGLDEGGRRRGLHLTVAGLATFVIVVGFGRASFAATAVVICMLFLVFRRTATAVTTLLPLCVPALVLIALLLPRAAPELLPTLVDRVRSPLESDINVRFRKKASAAFFGQVRENPLFGVGFGRTETFVLEGNRYEEEGPHNSFLSLWAAGGTALLGSFLLLALIFLRDSWRRLRGATGTERSLIIFAVATWFVFAVNALAGPVLDSRPHLLLAFWVLMLLPALVPHSQARRAGAEAA